MDDLRDVVVIGGGLAGLTAAAEAASAGGSVLLLDGHPAANRAGTDRLDGYRLNRGAHALYRTGAGRAVLKRLGVPVRGKRPPLIGARGRRGDVVDRLPLGPVSFARSRLLPVRDTVHLARVLAGMPAWRPERLADRTAAAWFDDLGLGDGARQMVEMLARTATYVADLDRVSADVVASQVRMALTTNVLYLHGGWATLLDGLGRVCTAHGVERRDAVASSVEPDGAGVRVTFTAGRERSGDGERDGEDVGDGRAGDRERDDRERDDGEREDRVVLARAVVVAAGTPSACASLLPTRPTAWADLGPQVEVACLDLGLARAPDVGTLLGLDRPLYLIRHSPPADLAPVGGAVVHGMRYLHAGERSSAAEVRSSLEEHARLGGIDPDAADRRRYLHRMVACGSLPTPEGGGVAGRPSVADTGLDGVFVAGDWLGGMGHLADAALATGEEAGRRAARRASGDGGHGPGRCSGSTLVSHG